MYSSSDTTVGQPASAGEGGGGGVRACPGDVVLKGRKWNVMEISVALFYLSHLFHRLSLQASLATFHSHTDNMCYTVNTLPWAAAEGNS